MALFNEYLPESAVAPRRRRFETDDAWTKIRLGLSGYNSEGRQTGWGNVLNDVLPSVLGAVSTYYLGSPQIGYAVGEGLAGWGESGANRILRGTYDHTNFTGVRDRQRDSRAKVQAIGTAAMGAYKSLGGPTYGSGGNGLNGVSDEGIMSYLDDQGIDYSGFREPAGNSGFAKMFSDNSGILPAVSSMAGSMGGELMSTDPNRRRPTNPGMTSTLPYDTWGQDLLGTRYYAGGGQTERGNTESLFYSQGGQTIKNMAKKRLGRFVFFRCGGETDASEGIPMDSGLTVGDVHAIRDHFDMDPGETVNPHWINNIVSSGLQGLLPIPSSSFRGLDPHALVKDINGEADHRFWGGADGKVMGNTIISGYGVTLPTFDVDVFLPVKTKGTLLDPERGGKVIRLGRSRSTSSSRPSYSRFVFFRDGGDTNPVPELTPVSGKKKRFRLGGQTMEIDTSKLYSKEDPTEDYYMIDKGVAESVGISEVLDGLKFGEARYGERIFDQESNLIQKAIMSSQKPAAEKQRLLGLHVFRELKTHADMGGRSNVSGSGFANGGDLIGGVLSENKTSPPGFRRAYSAARSQGLSEFIYKGKRYNTKYNGTPGEQLRQTGITDAQIQDVGYEKWRLSLPESLQDTTLYNLRGAYDSGLQPELVGNDYHLPSRNPETGEILKSESHPTFRLAIEEDRKLGYLPYVNISTGKIHTFREPPIRGYRAYRDGGVLLRDENEVLLSVFATGGDVGSPSRNQLLNKGIQPAGSGRGRGRSRAPANRFLLDGLNTEELIAAKKLYNDWARTNNRSTIAEDETYDATVDAAFKTYNDDGNPLRPINVRRTPLENYQGSGDTSYLIHGIGLDDYMPELRPQRLAGVDPKTGRAIVAYDNEPIDFTKTSLIPSTSGNSAARTADAGGTTGSGGGQAPSVSSGETGPGTRASRNEAFRKSRVADGITDLATGIVGGMMASTPIPRWEPTQEYKNMFRDIVSRRDQGLLPEERSAMNQGLENAYAAGVNTVRQIGGGGVGQGAALASIGQVSDRLGRGYLQAALQDAEARRRNYANYQGAVMNDLNIDRQMYDGDLNNALQTRNTGAAILAQSVQQMYDARETERSYGPDSLYNEMLETQLDRVRYNRDLARLAAEAEGRKLGIGSNTSAGIPAANSRRATEFPPITF